MEHGLVCRESWGRGLVRVDLPLPLALQAEDTVLRIADNEVDSGEEEVMAHTRDTDREAPAASTTPR